MYLGLRLELWLLTLSCKLVVLPNSLHWAHWFEFNQCLRLRCWPEYDVWQGEDIWSSYRFKWDGFYLKHQLLHASWHHQRAFSRHYQSSQFNYSSIQLSEVIFCWVTASQMAEQKMMQPAHLIIIQLWGVCSDKFLKCSSYPCWKCIWSSGESRHCNCLHYSVNALLIFLKLSKKTIFHNLDLRVHCNWYQGYRKIQGNMCYGRLKPSLLLQDCVHAY